MRTLVALAASVVGIVLALPVVLVIAVLWIVAAGTRGLARVTEQSYLTLDQLIEFDPVFGWRPRPNLDTHHLLVDLFRISTDAEGWRGRTSIAESDVVVIGDSFAAGYGISEPHLFANVRSQPRIKPVGIGGYSMVQELLWMQVLAPRLAGKLVVWFVFLGNDLYDNLSPELNGYRKPFVRELRGTSEWEIVFSHVSAERWPIRPSMPFERIHLTKLAELCSDTFLARRAFAACEYLIAQARQVCARAGADLVVMTIPDPHQLTPKGRAFLRGLAPTLNGFDPDAPDRKVASICRERGVAFAASSTFVDLSGYKSNDCHWNESGHRMIAQWLSETYAERRRESGMPGSAIEPLAVASAGFDVSGRAVVSKQ